MSANCLTSGTNALVPSVVALVLTNCAGAVTIPNMNARICAGHANAVLPRVSACYSTISASAAFPLTVWANKITQGAVTVAPNVWAWLCANRASAVFPRVRAFCIAGCTLAVIPSMLTRSYVVRVLCATSGANARGIFVLAIVRVSLATLSAYAILILMSAFT